MPKPDLRAEWPLYRSISIDTGTQLWYKFHRTVGRSETVENRQAHLGGAS